MKLDKKYIKVSQLKTAEPEYIYADRSELISMIWEITKDLWAFVGEKDAERRLQRNVVSIVRREG